MLLERGTIAGFRRHWPTVKIVGFQHPVVPPLLLCHYMTSDEARRAPLPDRIVCNGRRFRDALLSDGFAPDRVVEGPALRYAHLAQANAAPAGRTFDRSCILVALPLELGAAVELLAKVLRALGDRPDLAVKVKPHPMMKRPELMRHCGIDRLPDHFEFVEGGMDHWLDRARLIISAGSAVLYEAVAAGVPAIAVGREGGLNLNPLAPKTVPGTLEAQTKVGCHARNTSVAIPVAAFSHTTCYAPDEIRIEAERLWNLSASDREQRERDADAIRSTSFNPTNDETLRAFTAGLIDAPADNTPTAPSTREPAPVSI